MSNVTKKDFDDYLGKEDFFTEKDKKRFYQHVSTSKGWKIHWIPQMLTVAVIIGLFGIGVLFFQGNMPFTSTEEEEEKVDTPTTDWSNWITAEGTEEVDSFYEATVPGLKIAKELNQTIEVNQKYLLDDHVTLEINQAWYHEDKIYLFYSLDLINDEIVTDNQNTGMIYDFLIHDNTESTTPLSTSSPSQWSGVVLNNAFTEKLYRLSVITLEEADQLSEIDELTVSFTIDAHNNEVRLPEITLPVSYGNETITSDSLNETFQTTNSTITLNRMDSGAGKGYLFGKVDSEMGQEIEFLSGMITMSNGDRISVSDRINSYKNHFTIDVPELITDSATIEFDYLSMIENEDPIDISIDVSNYDDDTPTNPTEETMNQVVDEVGNTRVFVRSILFDQDGVKVGISTEKIDPDNSAQVQFSSTMFPEKAFWGFPNVLAAVDDSGEEADEYDFLTIEDSIDSEIKTFGLTKTYIKDKDQIHVMIRRLSFGEVINWKIEIQKLD